jgi:hypothetical protein
VDPRLYEKLMPVAHGPAVAVRRFNDQQIDEAVSRALASIPREIKGVSLDVDFSGEGVRGAIAWRRDRHWSICLVGEIKKGEGPVGGARVVHEYD